MIRMMLSTYDDALYPGEEEGDVLPPSAVPRQGEQLLYKSSR
jgi:hypothetical protein